MSRNFFLNIVFLIAFGTGLFSGIMILAFHDFEGIDKLESYQPKIPSQLLDAKGRLISEFFIQKRKLIAFNDIPKHLIQAFIAMEDNRFYDHVGVDIRGIVRAFFVNILAGRIKEGGSTITQQLSKVLLTNREKSYTRKIKEAWIALLIEQRYSKNDIITMYFNQIYLGHGAYGVEAAANFYFDKSIQDISIAEAALLSALPSAPNFYSPFKNPRISREKHKTALIKMVENGFISREQAEKEFEEFWSHYYDRISSPSVSTWGSRIDRAPYFTEYIRRKLEPMLGKDVLYSGGLKIYSTLDLDMQEAAETVVTERLRQQRSVNRTRITPNEDRVSNAFSAEWQILSNLFHLKNIPSKFSETQQYLAKKYAREIHDELHLLNFMAGSASLSDATVKFERNNEAIQIRDQVEAALISLDYRSGQIRAMVGGSGFRSDNQFNRTTQMRRQTGSSFKPFVYATALETREFTPASAVDDTPLLYLDEMGDFWTPENYTGEYLGLIRLRRALELSRNVISVRVAEKIGIDKIIRKVGLLLGIEDKNELARRFPSNLSISLGSADISPLEMAKAYSVFARGGRYMIPYSIIKIEKPDGSLLLDRKSQVAEEYKKIRKKNRYQVFSPTTATLMTSMLKSAARVGTGSLSTRNYKKTIAGKTGTTNNFKDAWFVGFNHTITTALWIGYDRNGITLGPGQSGGNIAAPTVGKFYYLSQYKLPDTYFGSFGPVVNVKVCAKSGMLPSSSCTDVIDEIFAPGTEPKERCDKCISGFAQHKFDKLDDKKLDSIGQKINNKINPRSDNQPVINQPIIKDSLFKMDP